MTLQCLVNPPSTRTHVRGIVTITWCQEVGLINHRIFFALKLGIKLFYLFICCMLFCDAFIISSYIASNDWMIDELESICKEVVVA
jgi:hypothetical protein